MHYQNHMPVMSTRVSGQKVRQVWTPEEDRVLSNAVAKGRYLPNKHPPAPVIPQDAYETATRRDSSAWLH